ncbi:MAG: DUF115 domain-containing protein [Methanobacteriaceae archaeon]|nr:DUF115 domain-containing protein [Methanobacteriaceae archaeon]
MDFNIWENYYKKILKDFNFSKEDDEKSANSLSNLLNEPLRLKDLKSKSKKSKKSIVFGAGPSLDKHINLIKNYNDLDDYILIAADGATTALLKENITPDIIVTDLDGKIEDLIEANKNGSLMVIHGHGNNEDEIKKYLNKFKNILGTTQSRPIRNLYNFGGFTDGDRAVFLASKLNSKKIILAGMDFGNVVTKYSRPNLKNNLGKADSIKEKKLRYASELIDWISHNEDIEIINLK